MIETEPKKPVRFHHLSAVLDGVGAIHENFGLDNGNKTLRLANGGVP